MRSILRKEINSFFSDITGYLVISVFLVASGLFLWLFEGNNNIFDSGFASLSVFFQLVPWILLFLIPAVTMRSFSEEKKQGTLEILLTLPLPKWKLIVGKFLGNLLVVFLALLPTLLYIVTLKQMLQETDHLDYGEILGSYLGLILLCMVFTAIGLFSSALTNNQIVSFVIAVLLCLLCFYAFSGLATMDLLGSDSYATEYLGIHYHYQSISRGVLDTRDLIYFLSLTFFFLYATHFNLKSTSI